MSKIEKAYFTLQEMEIHSSENAVVDSRFNICVSVLFLIFMLSVPLGHLSMLIWFALYPIIASAWLGTSFGSVFRRSLYVLPLVALIGIFNPVIDRQPAFFIGSVGISRGWISFISILLRGLMAMQAILILIDSCGFLGICRGLRKMHVPSFLTDQLQFVYRYMSVLMLEAIAMKRARESRGFGRKSFPIKLWGVMIGQLFLRSVERSERINRAMLARGFNGTLPSIYDSVRHPGFRDYLYLIVWTSLFAVMRFFDISSIFHLQSVF